MDQNDIKNLPRNDQLMLGAGILLFIFSFFPFYGYSGPGSDLVDANVSAWHSYGVLAMLLLLAAVILVAVLVFSRTTLPDISVSWNVVALGLAALGTLLLLIRAFTYKSESEGPASIGLLWGAWVVMILAVIFTALAFMRVRAAGDAMPWENRSGSAPPPAA